MSEPLELRILNSGDGTVFRAVRFAALRDTPGQFPDDLDSQNFSGMDAAKMIRTQRERDGSFIIGAVSSNHTLYAVVGMTRFRETNISHKGRIWGLYVRSQYRGAGLGKALIKKLIREAVNIPELETLTVCVRADNKAARRIFEKLGFKTRGIESQSLYYEGKYYDAIHYDLAGLSVLREKRNKIEAARAARRRRHRRSSKKAKTPAAD